MLIITRRPGEKIMLGDDIVVEVMEIVGNSVRIGVQAPQSVPVYREEIWEAVKEENRAAAQVSPDSLPDACHAGRLATHGATASSPRPPQGGLAVSRGPDGYGPVRPTSYP